MIDKMAAIFKKVKVKHIFIVYMICIANFVILKFYGDIGSIIDGMQETIMERNYGYWNINLIPFRSINSGIKFYRHVQIGILSISLILNVIVFIPMGFLIPFLLHKQSFLKTIGISLVIIICIELIQFVTCLGVLDIDDVILNTVGCIIGYMIYLICNKSFLTKRISKHLLF